MERIAEKVSVLGCQDALRQASVMFYKQSVEMFQQGDTKNAVIVSQAAYEINDLTYRVTPDNCKDMQRESRAIGELTVLRVQRNPGAKR